MGDTPTEAALAQGLVRLRRRRRWLWLALGTYFPAIFLTLRLTGSDKATGITLLAWLGFVGVASGVAGLTRCPRCANYFHMQGLMPVWVRRCLHCGLSLRADRPAPDP